MSATPRASRTPTGRTPRSAGPRTTGGSGSVLPPPVRRGRLFLGVDAPEATWAATPAAALDAAIQHFSFDHVPRADRVVDGA